MPKTEKTGKVKKGGGDGRAESTTAMEDMVTQWEELLLHMKEEESGLGPECRSPKSISASSTQKTLDHRKETVPSQPPLNVAACFDFAWETWRHSLIAQSSDTGLPSQRASNVIFAFPNFLSLFASLLQGREQSIASSLLCEQREQKPLKVAAASMAPFIRRNVFAGSVLSAALLQNLFNKWEAELSTRLDARFGRRLLIGLNHTHSYSLAAFNILSAQELDLSFVSHEKSDVEESIAQTNWLHDLLGTDAPKPAENLYAIPENPAFDMRALAKNRCLMVSLASVIRLPLPREALSPSKAAHAFTVLNGNRVIKFRKTAFTSVRHPSGGGPIKGILIPGLEKTGWGIWMLPSVDTSQASIFLIGCRSLAAGNDTLKMMVEQLKLGNLRQWLRRLKSRKAVKVTEANVSEILLPRGSLYPEEPLDLSGSLKSGELACLFKPDADLGELCPNGHLLRWLCVDGIHVPAIARWMKVPPSTASSELLSGTSPGDGGGTEEMEEEAAGVFVLRSTGFILLWDDVRNLPIVVARFGRPVRSVWPALVGTHGASASSVDTGGPQLHGRRRRCCHIL